MAKTLKCLAGQFKNRADLQGEFVGYQKYNLKNSEGARTEVLQASESEIEPETGCFESSCTISSVIWLLVPAVLWRSRVQPAQEEALVQQQQWQRRRCPIDVCLATVKSNVLPRQSPVKASMQLQLIYDMGNGIFLSMAKQ